MNSVVKNCLLQLEMCKKKHILGQILLKFGLFFHKFYILNLEAQNYNFRSTTEIVLRISKEHLFEKKMLFINRFFFGQAVLRKLPVL